MEAPRLMTATRTARTPRIPTRMRPSVLPGALGGRLLDPRVVATGLLPVTANLHVAPAPRAVPARVEKQPEARARVALADAIEIPGGQELRRRAEDGRQHRRQVRPLAGETPAEPAALRLEPEGAQGLREKGVERL